MDLTLQAGSTTLNIRVAVLIKTEKGFVFEKHKDGYYFIIGGRIKINETSEEAARREISEELGISITNMKLSAVIENFYGLPGDSVHEICFVYTSDEVLGIEIPGEFAEISIDQIGGMDVRPSVVKEVIKAESSSFLHLITRQ